MKKVLFRVDGWPSGIVVIGEKSAKPGGTTLADVYPMKLLLNSGGGASLLIFLTVEDSEAGGGCDP